MLQKFQNFGMRIPAIKSDFKADIGHVEQNWIRIIGGRRCRDKMERRTVVYDHCNELKDVDRD